MVQPTGPRVWIFFESTLSVTPAFEASMLAAIPYQARALGDRLLSRLRSEAEAVIRREPEVGCQMSSAVMKHTSSSGVVIQRLASRLGHADVTTELLRQRGCLACGAEAGTAGVRMALPSAI